MDQQNSVDGIVTLEHLIRKVPEGQETIFDFMNEAGENVKTVEIRQRKLQPELPVPMPELPIARAKARAHVFNDMAAFADYLNREAQENSIILADVESQTITAILDEADQDDHEQITLRAIEHPLFTPWGKLLDRPIGVIEFSLFAMKHRRALVEPDGRELAMIFSQVKMSKAIQIHSGVGKKTLNGVICDVEIAGERKGVPVELPESITIETPLFVGTSPQRIEIDLLVTNQGESVVVFCTAADVERQRIQAFEEMAKTIKERTNLLVGLGHVQERDWRTVPLAR